MPPFPVFFDFLVSAASDSAPEESLRSAWALFGTLTALLGLLVILIALLVTVRRRRARALRRRGQTDETLADPWQEAGRRVEG
ncbi:MAG: hypothetical protein GY715_09530 [Planctomycetes bacterium]|nr:hypothetical protein [Planctomycetota bacterium]